MKGLRELPLIYFDARGWGWLHGLGQQDLAERVDRPDCERSINRISGLRGRRDYVFGARRVTYHSPVRYLCIGSLLRCFSMGHAMLLCGVMSFRHVWRFALRQEASGTCQSENQLSLDNTLSNCFLMAKKNKI
jgi:hypothetical protein